MPQDERALAGRPFPLSAPLLSILGPSPAPQMALQEKLDTKNDGQRQFASVAP